MATPPSRPLTKYVAGTAANNAPLTNPTPLQYNQSNYIQYFSGLQMRKKSIVPYNHQNGKSNQEIYFQANSQSQGCQARQDQTHSQGRHCCTRRTRPCPRTCTCTRCRPSRSCRLPRQACKGRKACQSCQGRQAQGRESRQAQGCQDCQAQEGGEEGGEEDEAHRQEGSHSQEICGKEGLCWQVERQEEQEMMSASFHSIIERWEGGGVGGIDASQSFQILYFLRMSFLQSYSVCSCRLGSPAFIFLRMCQFSSSRRRTSSSARLSFRSSFRQCSFHSLACACKFAFNSSYSSNSISWCSSLASCSVTQRNSTTTSFNSSGIMAERALSASSLRSISRCSCQASWALQVAQLSICILRVSFSFQTNSYLLRRFENSAIISFTKRQVLSRLTSPRYQEASSRDLRFWQQSPLSLSIEQTSLILLQMRMTSELPCGEALWVFPWKFVKLRFLLRWAKPWPASLILCSLYSNYLIFYSYSRKRYSLSLSLSYSYLASSICFESSSSLSIRVFLYWLSSISRLTFAFYTQSAMRYAFLSYSSFAFSDSSSSFLRLSSSPMFSMCLRLLSSHQIVLIFSDSSMSYSCSCIFSNRAFASLSSDLPLSTCALRIFFYYYKPDSYALNSAPSRLCFSSLFDRVFSNWYFSSFNFSIQMWRSLLLLESSFMARSTFCSWEVSYFYLSNSFAFFFSSSSFTQAKLLYFYSSLFDCSFASCASSLSYYSCLRVFLCWPQSY